MEYRGPGGAAFEEDVYCTLVHMWNDEVNALARQNFGPGAGSVGFYPERLYSFAAPKGELDAATPLLQSIKNSYRPSPKWDAYVGGIQLARQKGAMDRATLQHEARMAAQRQLNAAQQKSWQEKMAGQDRVHEAFIDQIRGVQRFTEPTDASQGVFLPNTYDHAWSDGQGRYIVTDDPNFNPGANRDLTGTWQQKAPQERGQ